MDNLIFWGLFLLIAGIALLIKVIFDFDLPFLRILAGSFLVLYGLKVVFGDPVIWPLRRVPNEVFFRSGVVGVKCELHDEYQVIFGRATIDMSEIMSPGGVADTRITGIFSGSTVYLPSNIPVVMDVDALFAGVKMPGRNTPLFGRGSYRPDGFNPEVPHLHIRARVVFGNIVFMHKP